MCTCSNGHGAVGYDTTQTYDYTCYAHGDETCSSCDDGYALDANRTCADVDECLDKEHPVCPGGDCENEDGGFSCTCYWGFTGNDCATRLPCADHPCSDGLYRLE